MLTILVFLNKLSHQGGETIFPLPTAVRLAADLRPSAVEFRGDLWLQKTRVPGLSCGVVCVILRLAVLVELRLVTDRQTDGRTDTGPWLVPRMHSIAR